jgi:hypothetical protein
VLASPGSMTSIESALTFLDAAGGVAAGVVATLDLTAAEAGAADLTAGILVVAGVFVGLTASQMGCSSKWTVWADSSLDSTSFEPSGQYAFPGVVDRK